VRGPIVACPGANTLDLRERGELFPLNSVGVDLRVKSTKVTFRRVCRQDRVLSAIHRDEANGLQFGVADKLALRQLHASVWHVGGQLRQATARVL
jgi:hypothetical protein